ncbi:SDR family NAD(P)-dependent oxidoreductase [Luteitalea sp.]
MSQNPGSVAIVGATSTIATHVARLWAEQGVGSIVLAGRDGPALESLRDDLVARAPGCTVRVAVHQIADPSSIEAAADDVMASMPVSVLVAHGDLPDQEACQADPARLVAALQVNGVSAALWAEAVAARLGRQGGGSLVVLGSVAGDRGRKSNYVYGAAKGLLWHYVEGLQHRYAGSPVRIVLVKPGPTDTRMTAHLKARGANLAPPRQVAARIVRAAAGPAGVVYAPARWRLIMAVIRHLPAFVFNRLDI